MINIKTLLFSRLYIEVEEIYHLASPASPIHYMYNPVKTIKTNTLGTIVSDTCCDIVRSP